MMEKKHFALRLSAAALIMFIASILLAVKIIRICADSRIRVDSGKSQLMKRGCIKDASGDYIALSLEGTSVYVNPELVEKRHETAVRLSEILSLDKNSVLEKISRPKKFIWIKRNITQIESASIASSALKGVFTASEEIRKYPYRNLFSHVAGYCGFDNTGIEGIEYKYNGILNGESAGAPEAYSPVKYGKTVILTLDRFIQQKAYSALENAVMSKNAKGGTIAVIEVKTGKILALSKYPSFDPNDFQNAGEDERRFFGVTDAFEPGSVMKTFSVMAWLENTKNKKRVFNCTGAVKIADTVINCTGSHGKIGIEDAIRYSCNSSVIQSVEEISAVKIYEVMNRFGFGDSSDCGIAGEADGILRSAGEWSGLSKYSISIGQEVSVTVIQLAAAYSAIANGGVYNKPYIIDRIEDNEGVTLESFSASGSKRVASAENSAKMKEMLTGVIEKGTGRKAKLRYFTAAGKTGTARKFIQKSYIKNVNFSVFAGFAPADNSDVCMVVVIDEPQGITSASEIAAPVFGEIADDILLYRKNGLKKAAAAPVKKTAHASIKTEGIMPDLSGRSQSEILDAICAIQKQFFITYRLKGKGKMSAQSPPAGTKIENGTVIEIEFK